jgi:hypothetical protein
MLPTPNTKKPVGTNYTSRVTAANIPPFFIEPSASRDGLTDADRNDPARRFVACAYQSSDSTGWPAVHRIEHPDRRIHRRGWGKEVLDEKETATQRSCEDYRWHWWTGRCVTALAAREQAAGHSWLGAKSFRISVDLEHRSCTAETSAKAKNEG